MQIFSKMLKSFIIVVAVSLIGLSTSQQLANAEEYSNDELGFSFEYPDNWNIINEDYGSIADSMFFEKIVEVNDGVLPQITVSAKPTEDFYTKYLNHTRTSLDYAMEKVNSTKKDPQDTLIGLSKVDIGGYEGDRVTYMTGAEYQGTVYDLYRIDSYVVKDDMVVEISYLGVSLETTDSDKEIYNEVIESFQFE